MSPRHNVHKRFPWTPAALEAVRELATGDRSFGEIAELLKARGLTEELVDRATIRRAVIAQKSAEVL